MCQTYVLCARMAILSVNHFALCDLVIAVNLWNSMLRPILGTRAGSSVQRTPVAPGDPRRTPKYSAPGFEQ